LKNDSIDLDVSGFGILIVSGITTSLQKPVELYLSGIVACEDAERIFIRRETQF
jgi:hypothetical protein